MGELGLFGIGVPEEDSGPGFDTITYALVMEELSRGYSSVADQCGLIELITTLLVRHGTLEQKTQLLSDIMSAKNWLRIVSLSQKLGQMYLVFEPKQPSVMMVGY